MVYSENWYGDYYFDVKVLNKYDENYYKDLVLKLLSDNPQDTFDSSTHILLDYKRIRNTSFKIEDQLSDVDAVSMFIKFYRTNNKTTIFDCINGYYKTQENQGNKQNRSWKKLMDLSDEIWIFGY